MSTAARPPLLPVIDDHDTGGFWRATAEHRLAVSACGRCGRVLHLPRPYCSGCGAFEPTWVTTSGRGHVYSFTRVEHTINTAIPAPYTAVLVELDDHPGVKLIGQLRGDVAVDVGSGVEVVFEEIADGVVLPQWRAVEGGA